MAIFGAPIAHEDHARRACFAALHLTETLGLYARELRRERAELFRRQRGEQQIPDLFLADGQGVHPIVSRR
jgi:hypothetical protein